MLHHSVSLRWIWDHGKAGDPSLRMTPTAMRVRLTQPQLEARLQAATNLLRIPMRNLRRVIFVDEATIYWHTHPISHIAGTGTGDYIMPDVVRARASRWGAPLRYILAVNYWGGVVHWELVGPGTTNTEYQVGRLALGQMFSSFSSIP